MCLQSRGRRELKASKHAGFANVLWGTRLLELKDTWNVFWWATLNINRTLVCLQESSTGHLSCSTFSLYRFTCLGRHLFIMLRCKTAFCPLNKRIRVTLSVFCCRWAVKTRTSWICRWMWSRTPPSRTVSGNTVLRSIISEKAFTLSRYGKPWKKSLNFTSGLCLNFVDTCW